MEKSEFTSTEDWVFLPKMAASFNQLTINMKSLADIRTDIGTYVSIVGKVYLS